MSLSQAIETALSSSSSDDDDERTSEVELTPSSSDGGRTDSSSGTSDDSDGDVGGSRVSTLKTQTKGEKPALPPSSSSSSSSSSCSGGSSDGLDLVRRRDWSIEKQAGKKRANDAAKQIDKTSTTTSTTTTKAKKNSSKGTNALETNVSERQGRATKGAKMRLKEEVLPVERQSWFAGAVFIRVEEEQGELDDRDSPRVHGVQHHDAESGNGSLASSADSSGWEIAFAFFDAAHQELRVDIVTNVQDVLSSKRKTSRAPKSEAILTLSCKKRGAASALFSDADSAFTRPTIAPPHPFFFGLDIFGRRYWFSVPRAAERTEWFVRVSNAVRLTRSVPHRAARNENADLSSDRMRSLLALDDDDTGVEKSRQDVRTEANSSHNPPLPLAESQSSKLAHSLAASLKQSFTLHTSDETRRRKLARREGRTLPSRRADKAVIKPTRRKERDPANPLELSALSLSGESNSSDSDAWSDFLAEPEDSDAIGEHHGGFLQASLVIDIACSEELVSCLHRFVADTSSESLRALLIQASLRWLFETSEVEPKIDHRSDSTGVSLDFRRPAIRKEDDFFSFLPDEALAHIWEYLPPAEIGRMATVCRRFWSLSHDIPLWANLSDAGNWKRPGTYIVPTRTRSFYVKQYGSFRRREAVILEQARLRELQRVKEVRQKRAGKFLLCCGFNRIAELFAFGTIVYLSVIAPKILDGDLALSAGLLTPLWMLLILAVWLPCSWAFFSTYFDDLDDELDPQDNPMNPLFFYIAYILPTTTSSTRRRTWRWTFICSWTAFSVATLAMVATNLVSAQDDGEHPIPWIVALSVPLAISLCMGCCVAMAVGYDDIRDDEQGWDRIMIAVIILAGIVFFIFLGLKLDDTVSWGWDVVFIPIWIVHGLWVFFPLVLFIGSLVDDMFSCYCWDDHTRWDNAPWAFCVVAMGSLATVHAPLFAFELLLLEQFTERDDDGLPPRDWGTVFVPLYVLEGLALCGCCAAHIAAWK